MLEALGNMFSEEWMEQTVWSRGPLSVVASGAAGRVHRYEIVGGRGETLYSFTPATHTKSQVIALAKRVAAGGAISGLGQPPRQAMFRAKQKVDEASRILRLAMEKTGGGVGGLSGMFGQIMCPCGLKPIHLVGMSCKTFCRGK